MRAEVQTPAAEERVRGVQNLLCELIEALDVKTLRYRPEDLQRA